MPVTGFSTLKYAITDKRLLRIHRSYYQMLLLLSTNSAEHLK